MDNMAERFEELVIDQIADLMRKNNLEPPQLGRLAFKGERARKVIGQMLEGYQFEAARGKRRHLEVRDLYAICMVLNKAPDRLLALALEKLEQEISDKNKPSVISQKKQTKRKPRLILIVSNP